MKKFAYIFFLFATIIFTSCGVGSGRFKFEGKFLNMNQGEFYVYSPDGGFEGIDTVKVLGGRFTFETACNDPYTIMIVFPNFSEQAIFAESGKVVDIKADASHLKEMEVKGTKTNELLNKFRHSILQDTPPQEKQHAEDFIKEHPESPVSVYLVRRYFFTTSEPDYKKAYSLLALIEKQQPKNGQVVKMKLLANALKDVSISSTLPAFTAYDINGKLASSAEISGASVAVIYTWATYNYDSQSLQRELKKRQKTSKGKLKLMAFCLDASKSECKNNVKRDSINWPVICSGDLLEDKTLLKLGLTTLPDNIILQNGKIIARGLNKQDLFNKLDKLLK